MGRDNPLFEGIHRRLQAIERVDGDKAVVRWLDDNGVSRGGCELNRHVDAEYRPRAARQRYLHDGGDSLCREKQPLARFRTLAGEIAPNTEAIRTPRAEAVGCGCIDMDDATLRALRLDMSVAPRVGESREVGRRLKGASGEQKLRQHQPIIEGGCRKQAHAFFCQYRCIKLHIFSLLDVSLTSTSCRWLPTNPSSDPRRRK